MNFEENRLGTFRNWPTNAPVDAGRIAKAGFYYIGRNLEAQCFSCGERLSEWNYNDKVMTRHRTLSPNCSFVKSPALSGNVPITNRPNESQESSNEGPSNIEVSRESSSSRINCSSESYEKMNDESARLGTFINWPVPFIITPERLANAGFYYVQQGDKVRCAFCSVIVGCWEPGDDPLAEHRHHSPDCSFIKTHSDNCVPDNTHSSGITFRKGIDDCDSTMKSLGVRSHKVAKHPKYSSKDSRLTTYTTWPGDIMQTPDDLAEAGFYYAGMEDQVRCFYCDGGLRKWDPNDSPWVEHARWFPDCGFVLLMKGETFISDAIEQHPPVIPEFVNFNITKVIKSKQFRNLPRIHPVSEDILEGFMSSPITIAALQIGLDLSRVKSAIRQKLEQTATSFTTADALIEAALDVQLEEVPYQDSEETWSTPLHSPMQSRASCGRLVPRLVNHHISPQDSSDSSESEIVVPQQLKVESRQQTTEKNDMGGTSINAVNVSNSDRKVALEEENRRLKEARLCKICMDSEVCIVFLPCGHLVTCFNCAHSLADCPVCRRTIKATVRTFLS